jgi:hypothetical protein
MNDNNEDKSSNVFEVAKKKAAADKELLDLLFWIETLVATGVTPSTACSAWMSRKSKEPLIRLGSLSIGAS